MAVIFRLIWILWVLGFVVLTLVATSQLLFARAADPLSRWSNQIVAAILWPVAVFSQAGRESLRTRFRL